MPGWGKGESSKEMHIYIHTYIYIHIYNVGKKVEEEKRKRMGGLSRRQRIRWGRTSREICILTMHMRMVGRVFTVISRMFKNPES